MSDLNSPPTHITFSQQHLFSSLLETTYFIVLKNQQFLKEIVQMYFRLPRVQSLSLALYSSFKIRFLETFPSRLKDLVWHLLQGTFHGYKPFHISTEILFPLFSVLGCNFMSRRVLDSYFFYSKLKVFDFVVFWVLLFLRRNVCLLH